jgi:hypothetical protein
MSNNTQPNDAFIQNTQEGLTLMQDMLSELRNGYNESDLWMFWSMLVAIAQNVLCHLEPHINLLEDAVPISEGKNK